MKPNFIKYLNGDNQKLRELTADIIRTIMRSPPESLSNDIKMNCSITVFTNIDDQVYNIEMGTHAVNPNTIYARLKSLNKLNKIRVLVT